ncbi:hypothetical protein EGI16_16770 [Chryseobacterium sp. G0240]|uniref:hypothetical protein n=1 Tax=Chryseobacterium sp. G0240 TaxID=2487066 RepID=UPI000F44DE6F|nr:hypothetical protein [Chryseobacterium sp. G0240]ROI01549.1 hypothetical protein EGI16_16770 [Chryseobacterium sp. G0240]
MKTKILLPLLLWAGVIFGQVRDSLNAKFINSEVELDKIVAPNILRVEANLGATWRGVRGCGDSPTPRNHIEAAANNWIKEKMFENKNLKWIRYGWSIPVISIRHWKDPFPDRRNHCSGNANFKIYIDFEKK